MVPGRPSVLARYAVAVLSVAVAAGLAVTFERTLDATLGVLFLGAIAFSAWFGGLGPSITATLLSGLFFAWYFVEPRYSIIFDLHTVVQILVYGVIGLVVSSLQEARLRSERTVEDSREQLEAILQGIADGVTVQRPDGSLLFANRGAAQIMGYPDEAAVLKDGVTEIMKRFEVRDEHGQPLPLSDLPSRRALQGELPPPQLVRFVVKATGDEHWSILRSSPSLDAEGQVRFAVNIFRDITPIMEVETQLREERERLEVTLASIGDAVIATDARGCITFMNPVAEALTGWQQIEALGKPIQGVFRIVNEDSREPVENPVERVLRDGEVVGLANHTVLLARDGREIPIDDSGAPIRSPRGEVIGTVLVFRDISQRRADEAEKQRLAHAAEDDRQRLDALVSNVPGIVWEAYGEPDDSQQTMDYVSQHAEKMLGYPLEEWLSTPNFWLSIVHPEDREGAAQRARERFESGEPGFIQFRWLTKDGRAIWAEAHTRSIVDETGKPIGMRGVTMDISVRKRYAEQQRFLAEASTLLASSLEYETTLRNIARLAVPAIADWYAIDLLEEDGEIKRLAVEHVDPAKVELANRLRELYPPDPNATSGVAAVIRTGQPQILPEIPDAMIEAVEPPELREIVRELGLKSSMAIPLTVRGKTVGAISLVSAESGRRFDEQDVATATSLAGQIATAIDNARLYREAVEQRERLRVTLSSIGDAVIATDTECRITFMNPAAEALTGWSEAEAHHQMLDGVLHLKDELSGEAQPHPVREVLQRGERVELRNHTLLVARDGRSIPIDDSAAPIRDADGSLLGAIMVFRDVGERRQAEIAMRESEQIFRTMANSAPVMIWMTDTEGRTSFVSESWLEFTGTTLEQAQNLIWYELIHPDDLERVRAEWMDSVERREPFRSEYRLRRADGAYRWALDRGTALHGPDGAFQGYIGGIIDITDRHELEKRFRGTFEQAAVGIAHASPQGLWLRVNQKACDMLGYTREEMMNLAGFRAITHPDDYEEDERQVRRLLDGEIEHYVREKRYLHKNGRVVWALVHLTLVRDENGQPDYFIGVMEDISERRRIEAQVRSERERLRVTLASIGDAVIATDTDGNVSFVNPVASALTGWPEEEALGQPIARVFPIINETSRDPVDNPALRALREGVIVGLANHTVLLARDGREVPIDDSGAPIRSEDGSVSGAILVFRDITARRQAEAQIAARVREQAVVAELGQLALTTDNLSELMQRAAQRITEMLELDGTAIAELTPAGSELVVRAGHGWERDINGVAFLSTEEGSLAGHAIAARTPVVTHDWQSEERFACPPFLQELKSASSMCVVIPGRDGPFGTICTHSRSPRQFSSDDTNFLQSVAHILAQAVERSTTQIELEARASQQAAVAELGRVALSGIPLDELMQTTTQVVCDTLDTNYCKVLELLPGGTEMLMRAGVGWKKGTVGKATVSAGPDSQAGFTLLQNGPVVVDDLRAETRFTGPVLLAKHDVISGMSTVISGHARPFGVLGTHTKTRRFFSEDDVNFLQSVANLLAEAIERQIAKDEVEARVRQQAAVAELGHLALSGLPLQELMDTATRVVCETLELNFCKVLELLSGDQEMLLRAGYGWQDGVVGIRRVSAGLGSHGGFTLVSSQPVIIDDLASESRFEESLLVEHGVISGLSVIIHGKDRPYGVLGAHSKLLRQFSQDDINFLQSVANVLAESISRQRTQAEVEARARQQAAVAELGQRALGGAALPDLMNEATRLARETLDTDFSAVLGLTNEGEALIVQAADGWDPSIVGIVAPSDPDQSQAGYTLAHKGPVLVENVHHDPRFKASAVMREHGVSSGLSVIIHGKDRPYGVLSTHTRAPCLFSEDDSNFLQSMANVLAEAVERRRTDSLLKQSLARTRDLYQTSREIGLLNTPAELVEALTSNRTLRQASQAVIMVFDRPWDDTPPDYGEILAMWRRDPAIEDRTGMRYSTAVYEMGRYFHRNEPVIIADTASDSRLSKAAQKLFTRTGSRSLMQFPLVASGHWYGMLMIHWDAPHLASEEDARHMQGLVDQAAAAIYNFRLLEAEAAARQAAERADALKMKFLAMISHELRTPLTSIKGFATTLLAPDVQWDPGSQTEFVRIINEEADKLGNLIEQLLDLSRLEAGTLGIKRASKSLSDILATTLPPLYVLTGEHRLEINMPDDLPMLYVDSHRIAQVLTNIVSNAANYSPPGSAIRVDIQNSGDFVRFAITDQGPGIPPEERGTVFEAFRQASNRPNREVKGAGLGLAITKGLVEAHGGQIWIDERPGPGTTVCFTLPVSMVETEET